MALTPEELERLYNTTLDYELLMHRTQLNKRIADRPILKKIESKKTIFRKFTDKIIAAINKLKQNA